MSLSARTTLSVFLVRPLPRQHRLHPTMGNKNGITCNYYWEDIKEDKDTPEYKRVKIEEVEICMRSLCGWFGANHWSVHGRLSNGQYFCAQKGDKDGGEVSLEVDNDKATSCKRTWGQDGMRVRLSKYGKCSGTWTNWHAFRTQVLGDQRHLPYSVPTKDCQTFARYVIHKLTDKTVGTWPIENGNVYHYSS